HADIDRTRGFRVCLAKIYVGQGCGVDDSVRLELAEQAGQLGWLERITGMPAQIGALGKRVAARDGVDVPSIAGLGEHATGYKAVRAGQEQVFPGAHVGFAWCSKRNRPTDALRLSSLLAHASGSSVKGSTSRGAKRHGGFFFSDQAGPLG